MNCKTLFNLTKIVIFSVILCVFANISNAYETNDNENQQIEETNIDNQTTNTVNIDAKKEEKKEKSKIAKFVDKWFIPEQNPAFGEKGHSLGVQYAYDMKRHLFPDQDNRELHHFAVQYSAPNKFLGIHGRTNLGIGYLYGQDYWAKNLAEGKYNTPLFEIMQEFVFGNKYVYITCGVGLSWIVSAPMDYEWREEYTGRFGGVSFQNGDNDFNKPTYTDVKYTSAGMTKLNIPLTAALGHRFDNGLVVEIMWKHYSNGHIQHYNQEINTIGLSLRYTFGENKKI